MKRNFSGNARCIFTMCLLICVTWLFSYLSVVRGLGDGVVFTELSFPGVHKESCMLQTRRDVHRNTSSQPRIARTFSSNAVAGSPVTFMSLTNALAVIISSRSAVDQAHSLPHVGMQADSMSYKLLSHYLLPMLTPCFLSVGAMVIMLYLAPWRDRASVSSQSETAVSCMMLSQFVGMLTYSLPILHSFDLAAIVGRDASWSGQMVGVFALGIMVGGCALWLLMFLWPHLWRSCARTLLSAGLACAIVGVSLFLAVAVYLETGRHHHMLPWLLVTARFISGFGQGLNAQFTFTTIARLTPAAERPARMTTLLFANIVGVGVGPFLASGVQSVPLLRPGFAFLAWLNIVFLAGTLFCVFRHFPRLEYVPDLLDADDNQLAQSRIESGFHKHDIVVAGCLIMGAFRAYIVAALEVASALVFEQSFHWDLRYVGVAIAFVFLCSGAVKFLYEKNRERFTTASWIRCFCSVALAGTMLLLQASMCNGAMLMLSDMLTFPTIYLADGLALGVLQQNLLPGGSHFVNANTSMLYRMLLSNGVGRFLGPWFARWCIQTGGLKLYFCTQLIAILGFGLIFEVVVRPRMGPQAAIKT